MSLTFSILAQTTPPTWPPSGLPMLFPAVLLAMIVFMFLSSRSQKKREKREKEAMYARMSRNDRVLTIGGVIGTVVSTKDNEVIVKVDESTNTKMTFLKSSIQRILSDDQLTRIATLKAP